MTDSHSEVETSDCVRVCVWVCGGGWLVFLLLEMRLVIFILHDNLPSLSPGEVHSCYWSEGAVTIVHNPNAPPSNVHQPLSFGPARTCRRRDPPSVSLQETPGGLLRRSSFSLEWRPLLQIKATHFDAARLLNFGSTCSVRAAQCLLLEWEIHTS